MDKIKQQSNRVGELIFSADTGATYKKTLTLTWNILRETGILLWLVVCLVFVGAEWFWKTSISLGLKARTWYEEAKEPKDAEPKSASEIGQSMMSALGTGTENLLYQAKQQLGIEAHPPEPTPPKPQAIAKPPTPTPHIPAAKPSATTSTEDPVKSETTKTQPKAD